jgi:hypothetical protein
MPSKDEVRIIEQVTLRKLEYVRKYLESKKLTKGGTRVAVRERLAKLVDQDDSVIADLQALLGELDAWGDQRLKIAKFDLRDVKAFNNASAVQKQIAAAKMSELVTGEIAIEPPLELTPMLIKYVEEGTKRTLYLYAAKSRIVEVPDTSIPTTTDKRYPGVLFKPYRQEIQKALDFAEINLTNGDALFSTTLLKSGASYSAEFTELFDVFQPLLPLWAAEPVALYKAVKTIPTLPQTEVRTPARKKRTDKGGEITHRSGSVKNDLRLDKEIMSSERATANTDSYFCNCYWAALKNLKEPVHTNLYAPEGEISILGQVREASARHVLQRILAVN